MNVNGGQVPDGGLTNNQKFVRSIDIIALAAEIGPSEGEFGVMKE